MGGRLKTAKQIHYRSERFRRNILGEKFKELRGDFPDDQWLRLHAPKEA